MGIPDLFKALNYSLAIVAVVMVVIVVGVGCGYLLSNLFPLF